MYLWSIDTEAVLISMASFGLLCEEADIRCRSDDVTVTCLLPNYNLYIDIAKKWLPHTGKFDFEFYIL